jgi:hypothetical protein
VPLCQEPIHEVGADEARAAGDEGPHSDSGGTLASLMTAPACTWAPSPTTV